MSVTGVNPNPKNIVLCFDGTGDWAGTNHTNVMKMFKAMPESTRQKVFYYGGVGTLGSATALSAPKRLLLKLLDLAVATSLRDSVLDGYCRLANEYQDGDRIYLIGFSRGAFAARLVAAMIHNFGLIEKRNAHLAPYLWQAISNPEPFSHFMAEATRIKKNFARKPDAHIHFMGLFDTVSSVGIFERFKVFPFADTNPHVDHIRHAVSKDETRNAFPEQLSIPDHNDVFEVWFEGVHRDVGGGALDSPGLENTTLDWMVTEAEAAQIDIDRTDMPTGGDIKIHLGGFDPYVVVGLYPQQMFDHDLRRKGPINYSFARLWHGVVKVVPALLGLLVGRPWPKFLGAMKDSRFRYRWPNFKHVRRIPSNAFVADSYNEAGPIGQRFTYKTEATKDATFTSKPATEIPPLQDRFAFSFHDVAGTFLGVSLAFLMANRMLREPLGQSWPTPSAIGAFWLFVLFLIQQGLSQLIARTKFAIVNAIIPLVGLAAAIWLCYWTIHERGSWPTLLYAAIAGAVATLLAQGPFIRPFVRADRAIAFFIIPWFLAGLFLMVAEPVWNFVAPPVGSAIRWIFSWDVPAAIENAVREYGPIVVPALGVLWLLITLVRAQSKTPAKKKRATFSAIAGIGLWGVIALLFFQREAILTPMEEWWRPLAAIVDKEGPFVAIAWLAAIIAAISGAVQLVQDRIKMLPPKPPKPTTP